MLVVVIFVILITVIRVIGVMINLHGRLGHPEGDSISQRRDTGICKINGVVIVVTCCYSMVFSTTNNNNKNTFFFVANADSLRNRTTQTSVCFVFQFMFLRATPMRCRRLGGGELGEKEGEKKLIATSNLHLTQDILTKEN